MTGLFFNTRKFDSRDIGVELHDIRLLGSVYLHQKKKWKLKLPASVAYSGGRGGGPAAPP